MSAPQPAGEYAAYIRLALATEGGHLSVGLGGATIHYRDGESRCSVSGIDPERAKAEALAAGLPVVDTLPVPYETVFDLAVYGPMPAVGEPPSPKPWGMFSSIPLAEWAEPYRRAGAFVANLPSPAAEQGRAA